MRKVNLGGGVVALEPEGVKDDVESLDPAELKNSGWSFEAVENYRKYSSGRGPGAGETSKLIARNSK